LYQRIVLAYDGSREGRSALREGALLAKRMGAKIFLLAVIADTPGMRVAEAAHAGAAANQADTYKGILEEAIARLMKLGFSFEAKLVRGEPAQEITAYARQVKADLVVLGHRKQGLLARWWSASSGFYVSDNLDCSILLGQADISEEEFLQDAAGSPGLTPG
jgi:nucleotide-binding universal stress UspA family protein